MLPAYLQRWLDDWGLDMRARVQAALQLLSLSPPADAMFDHGKLFESQPLRVGTDCSGVESPIHALRAMAAQHSHVWSCECGSAPRKVISANSPPEHALYADVLNSAEEVVPYIDLYVAGFSCKPFSMLHVNTRLLEEDQAKIFYSVVTRIRKSQPASFVLENVQGIQRCMDEVMQTLRDLGYMVVARLLNPMDLGEPVSRPRHYFVGVRQDVAIVGEEVAQGIYDHVWRRLKSSSSPAVPLCKRLLPSEHKLVVENQSLRQRRWEDAKAANFGGDGRSQKWKQRHAAWQLEHAESQIQPDPSMPSPDELFLHLPRERDAWNILLMSKSMPRLAVADLSQSLGRVPLRSDCAPTITPGSHVVVSEARRMLVPMEKLLLHCLPVHTMSFEGITDAELEDMGGNMMHLQTVGVAMLVAISFVDWAQPGSRCGRLPHEGNMVRAVHAVPAAPLPAARNKSLAAAEKKLERQLRERFGLSPAMPRCGIKGRLKVDASRLKTQKKAKLTRLPLHKACLRGTRWAG
eukprot:s117_g32.t1